MPSKTEMHLLIRKFDGKTSLYFFSNSDSIEESVLKLNEKFSSLIKLEKKIGEYEELLKEYGELFEALKGSV